jgi:hypothetical protein
MFLDFNNDFGEVVLGGSVALRASPCLSVIPQVRSKNEATEYSVCDDR